jgi:hypothetical protein
MPSKAQWRVAVYHGSEKVFSGTVPKYRFSRRGIEDLLRRLLSHFALTPEQIVSASLNNRRGRPARNNAFDVVVGSDPSGRISLECGAGQRSFAVAVEE